MRGWKQAVGVVMMICTSGAAHAAIDPGIVVGAWLLNDADGVEAMDTSANGHHGQLQGGTG